MELADKLRDLRNKRGITQEELAAQLYVSRTAVSKWESGRGYPSIESLKLIARYFSVSVDALLSTDEVITVAEEEKKRSEKRLCDTVFGLLDICMLLLLFLPFFSSKADGVITEATLLTLGGVALYLKIVYFAVVLGTATTGILTLALQGVAAISHGRINTVTSLVFGVSAALLFMISLQPYAAVFAFSLLVIKAIMLIKRP